MSVHHAAAIHVRAASLRPRRMLAGAPRAILLSDVWSRVPSRRAALPCRSSCSTGNARSRSGVDLIRTGRSTPFTRCRSSSAQRESSSDNHSGACSRRRSIASPVFVLFPLRFTFQQPETTALPGVMFAALTSFDRPFNQAPSLPHRAAESFSGTSMRPSTAPLAMAAAHLVRAGRCVGAHHVPAPCLRYSDRRIARPLLRVVVALPTR